VRAPEQVQQQLALQRVQRRLVQQLVQQLALKREQQQLEPGSLFELHLVVLLHSLAFAPQLQSQVLLGHLTGLQFGQRQKEQLVQQQVFVQQILLAQGQGQLQQPEYLGCFR
jgi:hypothetical protein